MNRIYRGISVVAIVALAATIFARSVPGRAQVSAQPSTPTPIPAVPNMPPPERSICRSDFTVTADSPPAQCH